MYEPPAVKVACTLLDPHGQGDGRLRDEGVMDRHTTNFGDNSKVRFLSLKPRLFKYTTSTMETGANQKNNLRAEESQILPSASTKIDRRGQRY